eukprot:13129519-Ditylum_brightwellii.AAC.1
MNDHLEQFSSRDDGTPQVKLAEDKLMDTLKNAVPKSWQREMHRQRFGCVAKGQAKFIHFCKCLESLETHQQLAATSKSLKRKEAKRPMHPT